jgi:plasmid stability protein
VLDYCGVSALEVEDGHDRRGGGDGEMAEIKVRRLDDRVVAALKARAKKRGVSLEEEVRATLSASVAARRQVLARRAAALRAAAGGTPGNPELDSARIIREERDAWG